MAFAGISVECRQTTFVVEGNPVLIHGPLIWSENVASPGTTTTQATPQSQYAYFSICAAADSYIAIAATPDASIAAKRSFIKAGATRDYCCYPGDKVAFVLA